MNRFANCCAVSTLILLIVCGCATTRSAGDGNVYNVKSFGATGSGKTLDTPAINRAIATASANGGGMVLFPPGTYLCFSIHLQSNVALYLEHGSTILAADSPAEPDGYDPPEQCAWDRYQDFGHSHWHNSLMWGENLENISILGPGTIDGKGLSRGSNPRNPERRRPATRASSRPAGNRTTSASRPATTQDLAPSEAITTRPALPDAAEYLPPGVGNKAIALKLCRNVILRDFTIYRGGHFGILATGVDNFTLDNLKIDTNRDGMDIDSCRNVRISNCSVNSPADDGICLKADYGLGIPRSCENVTITNCSVSGYDVGTFLDGTYKLKEDTNPNRGGPTGRIKFGTESNGGFKNITISNCVFDNCRGLAIESVDGALLEDVTITNITMRHIGNSPIFLRLGSRMRGPEGAAVGVCRRIIISNIVAWDIDPRYGSIISGIPGHYIEDVRLDNIHIVYNGGGTKKLATSQPAEVEDGYPEPRMFGHIPAYGFFVRHVKNLEMSNINITYEKQDFRPPFILWDVKGADFHHVKAEHESDVPIFNLKNVEDFSTHQIRGMQDMTKDKVDEEKF